MNPTDTARALVEAYEAKVVQLTKAQKFPRSGYLYNAEFQHQNARAALLAHVAEMAQQLARYKEIYESNSAAFIAIRKAFGIEADETVVPYILKYAPPLATRPTEARDDG